MYFIAILEYIMQKTQHLFEDATPYTANVLLKLQKPLAPESLSKTETANVASPFYDLLYPQ